MNWVPNRKIGAAAGVGVPISVVLAWILQANGIEVPAEVGTAMGAIISTAIGYVVPEKTA